MNRSKLKQFRDRLLEDVGAITVDEMVDILDALLEDEPKREAEKPPVGEADAQPDGKWYAQLTKAGQSTFYLLVRGLEVMGQLTYDSDVKAICSALNRAVLTAEPTTGATETEGKA